MSILLLAQTPSFATESNVAIVVDTARTGEAPAAAELERYLEVLYPNTQFTMGSQKPGPGATHVIRVGTKKSPAVFLNDKSRPVLDTPGGYVVFAERSDNMPTAYIIGADLQGLWSGVYGLLEKLGCGFYLSFDSMPQESPGDFSFDAWQLENQPLVPVRLVFNWHNFLSGCSTWNLEHWKKWIVQSQKMGYNAVMVHAYGNNPMSGFNYRGVDKPVGYLSSTRVGRDWSTNHVNDVRRLYGGEVFDGPVFGSTAAVKGTDGERIAAARKLMGPVFAWAEERAVDTYLAVDIDTASANPQPLIELIPEPGRFKAHFERLGQGMPPGEYWLANPDTAEGYGFYKTEVRQLLDAYPGLDCLVAWHRRNSASPWMALKLDQLPKSWQVQFETACRETPEVRDMPFAHNIFAQSKIVRAFRRALDEFGRSDVRLAIGSWGFALMPAWHRFMPPAVALMPLDYNVLHDNSCFDSADQRARVAEVAKTRPVIPIAWAQHDDGNYVGRPYTPYSNFYDLLTEMKCDSSGYGIIHWTTKPLDLYFKSLVNQVWAASENESLETTCRTMAVHLVGKPNAETFGRYLNAWVTTMPKIGRETSDFFIDHELSDLAKTEAGYRKRMAMLETVDVAGLSAAGREWIEYFKGLERYILDVYYTEDAFNRAKREYAAGDLMAARKTMAVCSPEDVIRRFARFSQHGGLTRGEEGLIVTMNTRWLPHYVRFRQQLGVEPVRINFASTSHDLLAQSPGIFTFYFDSDQNVWQTLGKYETGAKVFELSGVTGNEICRTGIKSETPIEIAVTPIMKRDSRKRKYKSPADLPAGRYRLTLFMVEPKANGPGQRVFDVESQKTGIKDRIDIYQQTGGRNRVLEREYEIELEGPGNVKLTLTPVKGKALICGLTLDPIPHRVDQTD